MKKEFKRPEILIHPVLKHKIANELNCSIQTVMMAIKYVNNSQLGKTIREKARLKLIEEANDIEV